MTKMVSDSQNISPFEIIIISTDKNEGDSLSKQVRYDLLLENNYDVALDDRKESPGIKFKDAELLGIPFQ